MLMEAGQQRGHSTVVTAETVSEAPEPKTAAECKAVIQAQLREIRQLFAEMDQNRAEIQRKRAEIELYSARSEMALQRLRAELELLRSAHGHHAERAD
jgi:molecular chaperone GrpE (heat shock protein)